MALDIIGYLIIFGGAFIYGFTGALTPGPVLTAVISETPKRQRGYLVGPLMIVGHAILEAIVILAAFYGLINLIRIPIVYFIISTVGGSILIFMAVQLFYEMKKKEISLSSEIEKSKNKKNSIFKYSPVIQGIILSISNPFWILWWGTSGFTYMFYLFERVSLSGMLEFLYSLGLISIQFSWVVTYFFGHISSDFAWYSFVSISIYKGKKVISDRTYIVILICCGIFFSYLGVKFILCAFVPELKNILII
ncbi:MAG: LysE family transporter [Candidatus Helarchaeota archaeon]|nr:LysE family transporter [Candidatus Helarchaeota archaeon]